MDCLKDRAPRGGNREGFITILENLMTGIHFLYFPVEELRVKMVLQMCKEIPGRGRRM